MPSTKPQRRKLPVLPLLLGAGTLAVAVAVAGQQALAAQLGAWLAEAYEVGMQRWTPSEPQIPAYHS